MRTQILTNYDNKHADELLYPPARWHESEFNVLTMDEPRNLAREFELLYIEAQEYDFLIGKTPVSLPEYWEYED